MSLLDGLDELMSNPYTNFLMESIEDDELEFDLSLEAALDERVELSEEDIAAILDDDNPDNFAADVGTNDEDPDVLEDDCAETTLEQLLDALESDFGFDNDLDDDDQEPIEFDADECDIGIEEFEDDEDVPHVSIDSLLNSIF